jgi:hypothetical protein
MQETQKRSKNLTMINFVLITIILVLMPMPITISNVNVGAVLMHAFLNPQAGLDSQIIVPDTSIIAGLPAAFWCS